MNLEKQIHNDKSSGWQQVLGALSALVLDCTEMMMELLGECIQMLSQPACRTYVAIEKDSYPSLASSAWESHFHVLSQEYAYGVKICPATCSVFILEQLKSPDKKLLDHKDWCCYRLRASGFCLVYHPAWKSLYMNLVGCLIHFPISYSEPSLFFLAPQGADPFTLAWQFLHDLPKHS